MRTHGGNPGGWGLAQVLVVMPPLPGSRSQRGGGHNSGTVRYM